MIERARDDRNQEFTFVILTLACAAVGLLTYGGYDLVKGIDAKLPIPLAIATMAVTCILMTGAHRRPIGSLDDLIDRQSRRFRTLTTSASFNPDTAGPEWDPALSAEEWTRRFAWSGENFDEGSCAAALADQLGAPWRSLDRLGTPAKSVAIVCGLHAANEQDASRELRGDLAVAYASLNGPRLERKLKSLLARHHAAVREDLERTGDQHAFSNTALLGMLERARTHGPLPSAEFLWLKGVDRHLWYALNNLGRTSFHPEAVGVMAHFREERLRGGPIPKPSIERAVEGLRMASKPNSTAAA